jgi:hypothetical protein
LAREIVISDQETKIVNKPVILSLSNVLK